MYLRYVVSTRRSTRLSAAAVTAMLPVLTGKDDAFDGELSELSDSDTEMAVEATRNAHESASEAEEEHEDEGEWSEAGASSFRPALQLYSYIAQSDRQNVGRPQMAKLLRPVHEQSQLRTQVRRRLQHLRRSLPLARAFRDA